MGAYGMRLPVVGMNGPKLPDREYEAGGYLFELYLGEDEGEWEGFAFVVAAPVGVDVPQDSPGEPAMVAACDYRPSQDAVLAELIGKCGAWVAAR